MTTTAALPQELEIGLVQIRVSNLERSLTFYQNVIGLKILHRQGREVEMTADGVHVLLVLREIEQALILRRNSADRTVSFRDSGARPSKSRVGAA